MASFGCFIQNTRIRDDVEEIIGILAAINIENGEQFTVADAYNYFVRNKVEIDLESVAKIYEDSFDLEDGNFTSKEELDAIVSQSFNSTLANLVKMQPRITEEMTKQISPGKLVAKVLAGVFRSALVTDQKVQTVMKKFETLLGKAAQRVVDKSALPGKMTAAKNFEEIVGEAFDHDDTGIRTLSGNLNSAEQVWDEFAKEVEHYKRDLEYSDADAYTIEMFDRYTKAIIGKGYDLLISQKESRAVINGALIEGYTKFNADGTSEHISFGREVKRKGKIVEILDWRKLTGAAANMNYLRQNVEKVLSEKGFSDAQISRISSALENEYIDLRKSIIEKAAAERLRKLAKQKTENTSHLDKPRTLNAKSFAEKLTRVLVSNPLSESRENAAVRLIREALMNEGFYKDVTVNGVVKRAIDWNKVVRAGIAAADIRNVFANELRAQGYSDSQISDINKAMENDFKALVKAQKDVRLARLKKANGPAVKKLAAKVIQPFEEQLEKAMLKDANAQGRVTAAKKIINDVLIAAGFFAEKNVNGTVTRSVDWKKLAFAGVNGGGIADLFAQAMSDKGFSEGQITAVLEGLKNDLAAMDADIKAKGIKELQRRNKLLSPKQKTNARRLAELYTYGLFDVTPNTYDNVLNSVLGMSDVDQKTATKLKVFGKALQTLYATKLHDTLLTEEQLSTAVNSISAQMASILRDAQSDKSMWLKAMRALQLVIDSSLRFVLTALHNLEQNRMSNKEAQLTASLQIGLRGDMTPELKAQQSKISRAVFKEMVYEGGMHYGDLNTPFVNRGKLDDIVNKASTNKLYHWFMGALIGRTGLDAMDSKYKASITQKYFVHNLLKVLTEDSNPNQMSKEDALAFVSLHLTGTSFAEAEATARSVIAKINNQAGKKILNDSDHYVTRLAADIVQAQLMNDGTVTEEQILAANGAAYKAAGRDLGHEPNNYLSRMINSVNGTISEQLNRAIQERRYPAAAAHTLSQTIFRSIVNPFVGGGTNWIVLKTEKTGLGIAAGVLSKVFRGEKIDLSTDSGIKNLETALFREQVAANKMYRGMTGAAASIVMMGAIWLGLKAAYPNDDNKKLLARMQAWRLQNRWLSKYTDEFTPEWLLAALYASENKEVNYVKNYMGWNDNYSAINLMLKGGEMMQKGDKAEGWGKMGEAVGTKLNAPVPYELIRDIWQLGKGAASKIPGLHVAPPHMEFEKSRSFWQGFLKRGLYESVGGKYEPKWELDALPGISGSTVEQLKHARILLNPTEKGKPGKKADREYKEVSIENADDLKKYTGEQLKHLYGKDKNGKTVLIFNKNERPAIDSILATQK